MLDTWVNFKVCLLDKHLSGDVNFVYWIWLKSFSARKLTTFSWSRQWCYQLPWFCGKSWLVSLARISTSCYLCLKTLGKLTHTLYTYYVLTVNKKTIDLGKKVTRIILSFLLQLKFCQTDLKEAATLLHLNSK